MDEQMIEIYAKYDINMSVVDVRSNIFIDDPMGWTKIDEWVEGQDRYTYAHADNGDYVMAKHGKLLYDEQGRPNFHDNFVEWSEEEKEAKYPTPEPEPSELDKLKKQQELTDQAVQDLILMMMGGGE